MGNQPSRIVERAHEKRESRRKNRRRSTATLGTLSHPSLASVTAGHPKVSPSDQPRRKSITEFFTKRRMSVTRPSEEDFREYDRFQRQHYLLKSTRKSNAWAPIDSPATILDVGTGNGIWALEMSSQYSQSQVIGLDIRPPPEQTTTPKNLKFVQGNIHEKWPFDDGSIEYVFQRCMGQDIQKHQWHGVVKEMLRVLKPGGILELVEVDPRHHNPGPVQMAFDKFCQKQWQDAGLDFGYVDTLTQLLEQVGFHDVEHRIFDLPAGEWPEEPELKQFGFINKEMQKAYLRNRKNQLIPKLGMSSEDYDAAVQEMMDEFEEYHGFSRFSCWIARKPS